LTSVNQAFSQSTRNYKLFSNFDYINNYSFSSSGFIDRPTVGFGWQNKKQNWHEIELLNFGISRATFISGLRYQHTIVLFKSAECAFKPFVGLGLEDRTQYLKQNYFDGIANVRYNSISNYLSGSVSPGVQYSAKNSGFYSSLQMPINIFTLRSISQQSSPASSRSSDMRFDALPFNSNDVLNIRLGFGYRF
jgi:hypothetical protein